MANSNYTPSDGTLERFIWNNLIDAQVALINATSKRRSIGSVPVVVDTNPRHNKTNDTTISMKNYDQNNAQGVVVFGTENDDTFANHGTCSFIWGDLGNDNIRSHRRDVTISGGDGNDNIRISADPYKPDNNSLSGGAGDDTITIQKGNATKNPTNITIIGGTGDDRIELPARDTMYRYDGGDYRLQYKKGDGDDTVIGWYKYDTLYIEGEYSTQKSGSDVIVKVGNGSILLKDPVFSYTGINIQTVPSGTFGTPTSSGGTSTPSGGTSTPGGGTSTSSKGKYVSNITSNKTISGTGYADTVFNLGDTVKIDTGAGNDSIYSYSYYSTIKPGTGNDTVSLHSSGHHNVIQYASDDGNDKIYNLGSTDTLSITSGTYSSQTSGSDVVVTVGNGKITLVGGKGKTINIEGTKTSSTSSSKGKYVSNITSNKTISGTSHADTVSNLGDTVKIDTGAGNDSIYSYSYYSTIKPGTGNDTVSLNSSGHHNIIQYASGDGNDKIYNLGSTDTLSITSGTYSSQTSGSDVVVTVGNGKITLVGGKGKTINIEGTKTSSTSSSKGKILSNNRSNKTISGTSYADTLYNYGSNVSINGGAGNDNITSFSDGSKVTLIGGKGKDTIYSWSAYSRISGGDDADQLYAGANRSTVLGGAGNDSIISYGSYNSILGGAGKDTIDNTGIGKYSTLNGGDGDDILKAGGASKDTLIGGKGNDSLWGDSGADTFIYAKGDGKDIIFGFDNNDLLQITGTFSGTYNKRKKEAYFKVGSTASAITLKDFTATTFHVNNDVYKISGTKLVKK